MQAGITALLFDFTQENLDEYEAVKLNMTSGKNLLKDLIQFEGGEFSESPFVQLIEIACDIPSNQVKDEQISNVLGIDNNDLCFYRIYTYSIKDSRSYTLGRLSEGSTGKPIIITKKSMFEESIPIFEIRFKSNDKWSSWQAIAGKFIIAQSDNYGPGGIAGVYHSMTEKEIENVKQNFQVRYSGSKVSELGKLSTLARIINDPSSSDMRKIIDPNTFQILFDSQIIQEVSSDESYGLWRKFEERYR